MAFTIAKLNQLPKEERDCLYLQLLPEALFKKIPQIDPQTLTNHLGEKVVQGIFPEDENFACLEVRYMSGDRDCILACQISLDPFMRGVSLDFVTINNPFAERYNVDVDIFGGDTLYGTRSRNIYEEIRAMEDGLAPGMVRPGLRLLGEFIKCLERLTLSIGLKTITLGALYYHNAIFWERYGFNYFRGLKFMQMIDREFRPGGAIYERLDGCTPFRRRGMERTVRGRSWAIYDGILSDALGEDWESPQMYKIIGRDFHVNTFPDQVY